MNREWQKICVICLTVPDIGTPQAPTEGDAVITVQTQIAAHMMKTVGVELGTYTRLAAAIGPDTRPMLLPKAMYEGPTPERPNSGPPPSGRWAHLQGRYPILRSRPESPCLLNPPPENSIPLQIMTAFLNGVGQSDCPIYEDNVFALECRDNALGKSFGAMLEPALRQSVGDRIMRQLRKHYTPGVSGLMGDPSLIYHLGQQRIKLWTYIKYVAELIDDRQVDGFDPGSNFAILLVLQHPFAIEQIWHTLVGERQVPPGGAMLNTYHRKVVEGEDYMYLAKAARVYPPSIGRRPVIVGFPPPPLLR
ncbi:MAG TPA: hypothetical protein VGE59_02575 [Patescibacteria group bacterium]